MPPGYITTYGQVATLLGSSSVARHVGYAMAAAGHQDKPVPWHRVVNAKGMLSTRGGADGGLEQQARLEAEGISFRANGTIDVARHRYSFPGYELPDHADLT